MLPLLVGRTLADLLEDAEPSDRKRGIELAVVALVELHARGFTHGDAMAENVMIELGQGVAHWFDFENVHDANRPTAWCRADDVRALLATYVLRVDPGEAVGVILDAYADDSIAAILATTLGSVRRRSLAFHLGQAGSSFQSCREISRLLKERSRVGGRYWNTGSAAYQAVNDCHAAVDEIGNMTACTVTKNVKETG